MYDFKESIVPIPNHPAVKLHDCSSPKIMDSIFFFEFANGFRNICEEFPNMLCGLPCLRSVFGEVLENGPKVDKRPPIDVAHIHEK